MKSKHIYNGEIPKEELYNFINPIKMTLDVDKTSYERVFVSREMEERIHNFYNDFVREIIPSMSNEDRERFVKEYCTFSYVPHTDGYDFRFSPISFVNNLFQFLNIDRKIDDLNLDIDTNRRYFNNLVGTNIDDIIRNNVSNYLSNKESNRNDRVGVLIDIENNIHNITKLYDMNLSKVMDKYVIPKNMLFYLAYKSLIKYEHTRDEKYLVLPYEYYHNVYSNFQSRDEKNSSWPSKVRFAHRGRLWFDDFASEYEELIGKDKVIRDSDYGLGHNEIIVGCEILRPGEFPKYIRDVIHRGRPNRGDGENEIDYDKYINLLHRKINCYSSSGFDTFIKGELGLDGYVGFKYRNEYILLDQLYKTNRYGVKNLLIEPEAFFALPSDRFSLIRYPKPVIIEAKKKDSRIEKHYHLEGSNSFEKNVDRIITGPNVSKSTFVEEVDKLKDKMLIKIK